jgi:hypothetical protein
MSMSEHLNDTALDISEDEIQKGVDRYDLEDVFFLTEHKFDTKRTSCESLLAHRIIKAFMFEVIK